MKIRLLMLCILVGVGTSVKAQLSQGTLAIGGGISYTSEKTEFSGDEVESNSFSFTPSIGFFASDNLIVGINGSLSTSKGYSDEFDIEVKTFNIGIGPFVRSYIPTSNDKFAFYVEGGVQYVSSKIEAVDDDGELKSTGFGVNVSPGFTYFLNEHWGLDLQLQGIQYVSAKNDDLDIKTSSFTFGVDSFNPTLGFKYYF